jgi:hypothetical protein
MRQARFHFVSSPLQQQTTSPLGAHAQLCGQYRFGQHAIGFDPLPGFNGDDECVQ